MQGAATQAMCDIVEERQRRRCLPAAAPRRAAAPMPSNYCSLLVMIQLGMGAAAKCQIILAGALGDARQVCTDLLPVSIFSV